MKIVLIGAGNVATHLGRGLKENGHTIVQVYSKTKESALKLATSLQCSYTTNMENVSNEGELYISALKDSAFTELIPYIIKGREDALFVHTAGSLSMDLWKGHALRYGVLYPMQTFSKSKSVDFGNVPFFIEANSDVDEQLLYDLASSLSGKVYRVSSEQRKSLHIAAVFACNFSNHMYAISSYLLSKSDIPFEVMLPLIDETSRKVHELSPVQAQTGPAIRYDENVINRHLSMLEADPDIRDLYEKISKSIYKFGKK